MSNLIVMPGPDGSFADEPKVRINYAGRCLALNLEKRKVFQTYKFYLGPKALFATVPEGADMSSISTAVLKGELIDVTDQPGKGISTEAGDMSPVSEIPDPNLRKVFIGHAQSNEITADTRPLYIAIPSSPEEEEAMLAELALKGRIDGVYSESRPSIEFAGIQVSDIEYRAPIQNCGKVETTWSLFTKTVKLYLRESIEFLLHKLS